MGTSCHRSLNVDIIRDHPHAYGDKQSNGTALNASFGSSPRVWGQAPALLSPVLKSPIIPTRMGTSLVENISDTIDEDHPHAYGDKKSPAVLTAPSTGSSPRVWGQGLRVHHRRIQAGIIPTRMGTSPCGRCSCVLLADHPHAYGDK